MAHAAGPEALARAESPNGEGRFIQSLKTHLASRAFSDTRLFGRRFTVEDLVALFLGDLLAATGSRRRSRPAARWCSPATCRTRRSPCSGSTPPTPPPACPGPRWAYEPLGAAYWYARGLVRDETVLVADFGGGTSDFSVLRFSRAGGRLTAEPLAHSGVGVAGDTFDTRIVEHAVAPKLGKGATYRSFEKELPVPAYIHAAFAQMAPALLAEVRYHPLRPAQARRRQRARRRTRKPGDDRRDGHGAGALPAPSARPRAELSAGERTTLRFGGWGVRVESEIARADFESWIARDLAAIEAAVDDALARAGLDEGAIDAVFLTGGSSFVPAVRRLFARRFPAERLHQGDAFQSVASGLALLAADGTP